MNNSVLKQTKSIDYIILSLTLVIIALSCLYPTERVIFNDTSFYTTEITFNKSFYIATNRYIAVACQALAVAAVALGFSLKTVVLCYSINFALFPIICAGICRFIFKDQRTGLAILLFYLIMGSMVFYYPVSEYQMGLCLLFVFHSMFINARKIFLPVYYIVTLFLITTIIFSHPLTVVVLPIWAGWVLIVYHNEVNWKHIIFPLAVSAIAYFVKQHYFLAEINGIDVDADRASGISNFTDGLAKNINSPLGASSLRIFTGHYFIALIMLGLSIISMCKSKKWVATFYSLAACCFIWLLVTASFRNDGYNYYYEHLYQGLPFFIALFFVNFGIEIFKNRMATSLMLIPMLVIVVAKVNNGHAAIKNRQDFYRRYISLMKTRNIHKAVLKRSYITSGDLNSYWSSCAESLLLSSLEQPQGAASLYMIWGESELKALEDKKDIMSMGGYYIPISQLPKQYFNLDTTRSYINLENVFGKRILDSLSYQR